MKKAMVARSLFLLFAAVALLFFYIYAHPLYIYDVDDWTYITFSRHAIPSAHEWNPTRILPETIMPLSALIGVDVIMPFTGDYIHSIGVAFAIVLVLFILFYLFNLGEAIKKTFGLKEGAVIFLTAAFLLMHFVVWKSKLTGTPHMLHGGNVTCFFFYLIPELLNATLVMWLMANKTGNKEAGKKRNVVHTGLMFLVFYLALNSNLFHSIILASFAGANILRSIIRRLRDKGKKEEKTGHSKSFGFIRQNAIWIAIIVIWIIVHLFEMNGGRAGMANAGSVGFPVGETIKILLSSLSGIKVTFLICVAGLVGIALVILLTRKIKRTERDSLDEQIGSNMILLVVSFVTTLVYLILLCTKVSPDYIGNTNVQISFLFWIVLMTLLCFGYIIARYPKMAVILPLFVFIMIFETMVCSGKYENIYMDAATVKALDENIINQVKEAESNGLQNADVFIPEHPSPDWPLPVSYGGERIANSLYKHGIIKSPMKITLVPAREINTEFGIE